MQTIAMDVEFEAIITVFPEHEPKNASYRNSL